MGDSEDRQLIRNRRAVEGENGTGTDLRKGQLLVENERCPKTGSFTVRNPKDLEQNPILLIKPPGAVWSYPKPKPETQGGNRK